MDRDRKLGAERPRASSLYASTKPFFLLDLVREMVGIPEAVGEVRMRFYSREILYMEVPSAVICMTPFSQGNPDVSARSYCAP